MIQKLAGSNPTDYNWTIDYNMPANSDPAATAVTDPVAMNSTSSTHINLSRVQNSTDLSMARTILHEAVHAYVVSVSNTSSLTSEERKELLGPNWIIAYINDGHDYIAGTYVSSIADVLQEYGQLKGYTMDRQFYEDLAWGGLQGTDAFNNLSSTAKKRILDLIAIELTGKDRYGNNHTQKGTDAGC